MLNHKNLSDSKKFDREWTTLLTNKNEMLKNCKDLEGSLIELDVEIEQMLVTLFKLVKECVSRNIPPSSLVMECNLSIDEAALHNKAFELNHKFNQID